MENGAIRMEKKPESCLHSVEAALDIVVGKWKPIILLHLLHKGTLRFGELKRRIPNITQKMLTAQLRELEEQDIVERKVYPVVPPKVEYSVTEYGRSLQNILEPMHVWGVAHLERMNRKKMEASKEEIS
jgi:DNA-binding HxlR family transcriptional regulator